MKTLHIVSGQPESLEMALLRADAARYRALARAHDEFRGGGWAYVSDGELQFIPQRLYTIAEGFRESFEILDVIEQKLYPKHHESTNKSVSYQRAPTGRSSGAPGEEVHQSVADSDRPCNPCGNGSRNPRDPANS